MMPTSIICDGCGHKLIVRDELISKRVKCPQCQNRFVAQMQDEPEDDGVRGRDGLAGKIISQWPAFAGFALIILGILVIVSTHDMLGGRMITRAGLALIGLGIASLGYWALSSSNKDYNF
jgi:hypothetical protein